MAIFALTGSESLRMFHHHSREADSVTSSRCQYLYFVSTFERIRISPSANHICILRLIPSTITQWSRCKPILIRNGPDES